MADHMLPAHIARLMTFAQHGQPSGYAASDMMRSDLETLILSAAARAAQMPTDEQIAEWADGFIRKVAFNRPIACQIAIEAAKWVRGFAPPKTGTLSDGFALELSEKVRLLGLPEDKQKAVADVVFWAMELAASPAGERQHHAALQRIGYALGLLPGADLHQQCVPAIEALKLASSPVAAAGAPQEGEGGSSV